MADSDLINYMATKGRKPSFGRDKQGDMQLRGFRSRPGAPQHDPNTNRPMSRDNSTPQSAWDRAFRDTASNNFGATENPLYVSSFPSGNSPGFDISSAEPTPGAPDNSKLFGFDISGGAQDQVPTMEQLANGGMSHQDEWSKPTAARGWDYAGKDKQQSIFDRYKTKDKAGEYVEPSYNGDAIGGMRDTNRGDPWGWSSAFKL